MRRKPFTIFISYRRSDTPAEAGVLFDALANEYGDENVFMDVELPPGTRYEQVIMERVHECDVLIALVGPNWLSAEDEQGRRLDDADDLLRREVATALDREADATVIPVLAGGTEMPKRDQLPDDLRSLPAIQSFRLHVGRDFRGERQRLIAYLNRIRDANRRQRRSGGIPHGRIAAAVAVVAACVIAALAFAASRGGGTGATSAGPMLPHGGDAIEVELLRDHIPARVRKTCSRAATLAGGFLRTQRCRPAPSSSTVTYSRAHSLDSLAAKFREQMSTLGITQLSKRPGDCARFPARGAASGWARIQVSGHAESVRRTEGSVVCWATSNEAHIAWTDTPTKIFALATSSLGARAKLYRWWQTTAGPERGRPVMSMNRMWPWPDAIERDLVLDHVPRSFRPCARVTPPLGTLMRTVSCPQTPGSPYRVTYSYAHSGTALNDYFVSRLSDKSLSGLTGDCAHATAAAATRWMRPEALAAGHTETASRRNGDGRLLCYSAGGKAWLEWTDPQTGIYGQAERPVEQWDELFAWWGAKAGPAENEGSEMPAMPTSGTETTADLKQTDRSMGH